MTVKRAAKKVKTKSSQTPKSDIITLILEDHKPLKKLIKVLKNSDKELDLRKAAFEEFSALLIAHAKSEEQVLYAYMQNEEELREGGFEGAVEHHLAEQMVNESNDAEDDDNQWAAKAKVLAELVEHHIEEEEEELLPDFKKHSEAEERARMGEEYLALKQEFGEGENEMPLGKNPKKKGDAHTHM